jgi:hypothetical protein
MAMLRERFASMLDPYIFGVYEQVIEKGDDIIPRLFGVSNSELSAENVTGIGATGLMQPWQGQVYYDDVDPLWDKTYTHEKYSIGLKIDRDLWDDAQHNEVRDRVQRVTLSVHRSRQIHGHSVFNNAFTAGAYAGPDSVALCSAAHPYSPSNATTQSNAGTSALSVDSLEATRIAMMNFVDDRGKKMLVTPDTLIVPPALEMTAKEIILSTDRPDTADRATNVQKGSYKIVTLPLLTDSNNWFLADSAQMKLLMKWFERRKPVPERDEDFDTEMLKWKYVCRYSYGFHGWWFIMGHNVT